MTEKGLEIARKRLKEYRSIGKSVNGEKNLIKRAKMHPGSLKKAIGAFCFHCMGGTEDEMPDPGWKGFTRDCTSPTCPLYPHRPYKSNSQVKAA